MDEVRSAFSIADFCKRYGVGRSTAYEELRSGRLKARKAGSRTLVAREDADRWLGALPQKERSA